ncbi:GNAT family N-acetyltransferase [Trinickia sp. LjRoot230]|uniref:GNAT family N-acetyltransferase n=1 Tax=Trinickia sp. LjRoot230 TaxID=3342288 RepID=UPI003ED08155
MLKTMDFRRATSADEPSIRALVEAAYAPWIPIVGTAPEPLGRDYGWVLRNHAVWVYSPDDATIDAMLELVATPDYLHIANLAVSPARQAKGLGSALLQFAQEQARQLRLPALRLCLNQEMVANRRFYERRGYALTHTEWIDGLEIAFMKKGLRHPDIGEKRPNFAHATSSVRHPERLAQDSV